MNKNIDVGKLFTILAFIALSVAAYYIERVNYITTYDSLVGMFGASEWVFSLSISVVLADLAGVLRVIFGRTSKGKKGWKEVGDAMLGIWFTVSAIDVFLNWWFAALKMESNHVVAPAAVQAYINWFPVIIAIFIFGIQFGLIYIITKAIEQALASGLGASRSKNQQQQRPTGKTGSDRPGKPYTYPVRGS